MTVFTTGQIAEVTGEDRDRVSYAIRKAGVEPVGRAGIVRLFPPSAIEIVRTFLNAKRKRNEPQPVAS